MKNTYSFIIKNLWWMIPLISVLIFWDHSYPILLMLIIAYLGQVILKPVIVNIEGWIGNRRLSVIITMILLLIFFLLLSNSLFPFIGKQIIAFQSILTMQTLTKFVDKLLLIMENILPNFIFVLFNDFINQFNSTLSEIWSSGLIYIRSFIGGASTLAFALGSAFLSLLIIFVFMVIFLLEGDYFINTFLNAVPKKNYETIKRVIEKITKQINAYIRGQLIAASSVAITSIVGLYVLQWITGIQIPYTFIIGVIAGLFNLIPFVGPIVGMIPALIMYLITDQVIPIHIIYVLLIIGVFMIVQLIDNLIMSPYIMGDSIGLHPILIIIFVLFGASVGGILGMLFIIPIVAIIKVIVNELVDSL